MKIHDIRKLLYIVTLIFFSLKAPASFANEIENFKIVNGMQIYYGIIPSEIILGHPNEHIESKMHGGVPSGTNQVHLVVALFDNATGERITNAHVTATIKEDDLTSQSKELEPMKIANTISYGNYFIIGDEWDYSIDIQIRRPEISNITNVEFMHKHFP